MRPGFSRRALLVQMEGGSRLGAHGDPVMALHVARPVVLWAFHFMAIQALVASACAPDGTFGSGGLRLAAGSLTLGAALLALFWLVSGLRRAHRLPANAPQRSLAVMAVRTAGVSIAAVLADLWPVFVLADCTNGGV